MNSQAVSVSLDRGRQKAFRSRQAPKMFVKQAGTLPHNAVSVFSREQFSLIQGARQCRAISPQHPCNT